MLYFMLVALLQKHFLLPQNYDEIDTSNISFELM